MRYAMAQVLLKSSSFLFAIILGMVLRHTGFFGPRDYIIVMKLVLNITLPAAVITSFASYRPESSLLLCPVVGFCFNWILLGISYLLSRRKERSVRAVWLNSVPGYNIGAFALPFVQSFLSPTGVVSCCLFDAGSALMCTGGTYAISGLLLDGGNISFSRIAKSMLSSRPFLTYALMLILSLAGVAVPQPIAAFLSPLASANAFLAMMMVGMMFDMNLNKALRWDIVGMVAVRVVFAIMAACVCLLLPFPLEIRQSLAIASCAPVSVASTAFSERSGGDPALAASVSSLTIPISIACIITMLTIFGVA